MQHKNSYFYIQIESQSLNANLHKASTINFKLCVYIFSFVVCYLVCVCSISLGLEIITIHLFVKVFSSHIFKKIIVLVAKMVPGCSG